MISKGFYPSVTVQDFTIYEHAVWLHVRRRKWQVETIGEILSNTWDTTAKGTRYTMKIYNRIIFTPPEI